MRTVEEIRAELPRVAFAADRYVATRKSEQQYEIELRAAITTNIPIDRLKAICAAEKDGRVVVLPCNVGDTVYKVDVDCVNNPDNTRFCFCWNKACKECENSYLRVWESHNETTDVRSIISQMGLCGEAGGFGKTVFLTRAEAEAELRKAQT